jgi:hypothetical protein
MEGLEGGMLDLQAGCLDLMELPIPDQEEVTSAATRAEPLQAHEEEVKVEEEDLNVPEMEEEEEDAPTTANQQGKIHPLWAKANRKIMAYAAIAHPRLKKLSPTPPPSLEEMNRKAKEGLGLGLTVRAGTNKIPEFATTPDKRGIYSFVSPSMKQIKKKPLSSVLFAMAALFIGGLWETVWLFLLTSPYAMLSRAQYECQEKLTGMATRQWKLKIGLWTCATLRAFIRFWATGKWVAILALAMMEKEEGEAIYWNFRIPLPSIIYTTGMSLIPFFYNKTRLFYTKMKGLWRQPSRRHRRHQSIGVELSGHRGEP